MGLHFFGLSQDYRKALFRQIHEIIFHGGGGYDYETVYNMPIWLRKFTFGCMKEHFEKEKEAAEKVNNKLVNKPTTTPTYTTKARK